MTGAIARSHHLLKYYVALLEDYVAFFVKMRHNDEIAEISLLVQNQKLNKN
jgi:hypothetical protein